MLSRNRSVRRTLPHDRKRGRHPNRNIGLLRSNRRIIRPSLGPNPSMFNDLNRSNTFSRRHGRNQNTAYNQNSGLFLNSDRNRSNILNSRCILRLSQGQKLNPTRASHRTRSIHTDKTEQLKS